MKVRKAFQFIDDKQTCTKVIDKVSATIPDQSISLREMMLQFAYIGDDRIRDILERGWYEDEDADDILGVDVGALDFAEVHDRVLELMDLQKNTRAVHAPRMPSASEPSAAEEEPEESASAE